MPPVAPVIRIFLFLNSLIRFLISVIELIEKEFTSFKVLFYHTN